MHSLATFAGVPSYLIKTFTGLELPLERELLALGATSTKVVSRGVLCKGSDELMYRANLELRTGLRVYRHLTDVSAHTPEDFYQSVGAFKWHQLLRTQGTFWVTSTVAHTDWVDNTMIVTYKTKDAIVDALRSGDARPSVDRDRPDLRIHAYIHRGEGSLWLDSTGDPLFRRGVRLRTEGAPINPVLAAGLLQLADYRPSTPLVDPMCGSGTIAIEAARMAMNIPSQGERKFFAFMNWPDFDRGTWAVVKQRALSRIERGPTAPIVASDVNWRSMRTAEQNVREAGMAKRIELHEADFFSVSAPYASGKIIFNPPYDERLSIESGEDWYASIGNALKTYWTGWDAFIVSGFAEGMRALSLAPKRKFPLDNGGIPVELWSIPLYQGSKRTPRPEVSEDATETEASSESEAPPSEPTDDVEPASVPSGFAKPVTD